MRYKVFYTGSARRDIRKLDSVSQKRLSNKLKHLFMSPLKSAKKLVDPSIGSYRWRVGNLRIIFDINGNKLYILRVGHRKEIYRK